jgi:hypothetical protein
MIKKLPLKLILTALVFVMNLPTIFAQGLMKEVSLEKQIENSSLLIEGKVLSKKSFWDNGNKNIYTVNTIQVHKVFKGEILNTVDVITLGGVVGLKAEIVTPSLSLNANDVGIFMLHDNNIELNLESKENQFKPYSGSQGFYKYNLRQDVAINPFKKKAGIVTSFYNQIMNHTKANYVDVFDFDVKEKQLQFKQGKSNLVPSSITFTPSTITAGTKTVLTINGSGFGATKGKVGFSDPDEGGSLFFEALDTQVLTWSDTQITVEVPSRAGTGIIQITDSSNASANSSGILTVLYSEINIVSNQANAGPNAGLDVAYLTKHVNDNGAGGYTWQMFTDFDANALAKASFLRAFETWRCESDVNWVIGATTTTNIIADDGVNVIRFDVEDELGDNLLGRCTSRFSGCFINGNTAIDWFVDELDIVFNDSPDNTGSGAVETWNFGTGASSGTEYDFESVALHELGHGHQLAHVIDSNADVMHFNLFNGQDERALGVNNISAAADVHSRSTSSGSCGVLAMTDYAGSCGLSVEDNTLENSISLYPNPAKQQFFIKSAVVNLDKVEIYDVSGRLISEFDVSEASRTIPVNLLGASKGVYFVNLHSEGRYITKKLVIN